MYILFAYIFILCSFTFLLMFLDKQKAIKGDFRISESTFIKLSIAGGALGTYLGMYTFRHKTLHKKFYIGIPFIIIFNIFMFYTIYKFLLK